MASIGPSTLMARIDAGAAPTILDVRSRREFEEGHLPGALHVPFWTMLFRAARIPRAKPVVVYCGHGPRARLAGAAMRLYGFRQVMYLDGHMSRWRREGLPQESGSLRE